MGANNNNKNRSTLKRYKGKNVSPLSGPVQMGQYAARLFRNIAFGNFDYEKDSPLFQNQDFLMAASNEAYRHILDQQIYNAALGYAYGASSDPNVIRLMNKHKNALDGWYLVYNTINGILQTGDMGLLAGLMNRLPDYKRVL